jgi:ribulose-5-phosphate 4-epimerase/fuculose-1-phosphate aldolase
MNTHAKVADISRDAISPAEWQARVDLAAVYRLVAHYGWDDVIYNHSSMRVPGEPRLHGGVLSARDDVNCAVHVHTNTGMAIAGLKHGLKMVSQQAMRFYQRLGYHAYEGITEDFAERERINRDLGKNRAMIMHNHGLLTVGRNAREAFVLMKTLIEAADIQLRMEATGGEMLEIPAAICAKTAAQYETHDSGRGSSDWPAYLRLLDTIDPRYRQ